jgi:quercetin dioxygenase-like cupin family protein
VQLVHASKPFNPESAKEFGIDVAHHFAHGMYAKEVRMPANTSLISHKHNFDHLSVLASGSVLLECDGVARTINGPQCITIAAHKKHAVTAITDAVWYCVHPTNETDETIVDGTLIHD